MNTAVVVLDSFNNGMTNDARGQGARIIKHLDTYTEPSAISVLPDNDATTADRGANTFDNLRIEQFVYASYLSAVTFFGLGVQSGTTKPEIYYKTGVADGAAWTAVPHTASAGGDYAALTSFGSAASNQKTFALYQNYLYGMDGAGWWKYGPVDDLTNGVWTRGIHTDDMLNDSPPIVHPKDDIMYFASGQGTGVSNRIIKLSTTTWSTALILPLYSKIPAVTDYKNYLAIPTNNSDGTCTMYLWDRDSSMTTISEKIDWGSGTIKWANVVGGILVACSVQEPSGLSISPNVVFKYYNGAEAVKFAEFTCSAATIERFSQRFNNQIKFLASMTINGTTLAGTWRVTKDLNGLNVSFDQLTRLDDTPSAFYGFLQVGDYLHTAVNVSGYLVTKTGSTYTTTTSYETTINPGMPTEHKHKKKQLMAVAATYDPLPAGAGVIVQYKVDGGSWIDIVNDTLDGSVVAEMPKANTDASSNGTTYSEFTAGRDYEFRVKPNGSAKVTGLIYKYNTNDTLI